MLRKGSDTSRFWEQLLKIAISVFGEWREEGGLGVARRQAAAGRAGERSQRRHWGQRLFPSTRCRKAFAIPI